MKPTLLFIAACALCLLASVLALAQQPSPGEAALSRKDWTAAEKIFRDAVRADPKDGAAWFHLGEALYGEQKFNEAAEGFKQAAAQHFQSARSQLNEARSFARAGDANQAFTVLNELNRQGFPNLRVLTAEADFRPLQSDARWQSVVAATTANATPCEHTVENRQFDFWIGEWSVQTTTGQPAGTSKVERILGGCALLENWSGGGDGKSLNIYNVNRKQWQQFWVDSDGEVHEYSGNLVDGEMRFEGPAADHAGNRTMRRMTFTRLEGGRVRQKGEMSPDGSRWTLEYELVYVPKT